MPAPTAPPGDPRRRFIAHSSRALAGAALAGSAWGAWAQPGAEPVLRVLAWPGYADPDVVQRFERRHRCRVEVTLVDADETLWRRMQTRQGYDFDVFAVNTAELQRYIANGLVADIPAAQVPATGHLLPRFRELAHISGLVHAGKTYGVPYAYAEMGLIFDRRQVTQPPVSVAELWHPRWQGKVLAYNGGVHNFSLAAQRLGWASPFRLNDNQWPAAVESLIDLRRNVMGFYTQPEESVQQFMRREAALMFANYGSQQVKLLQAAGAQVGYVVPREGALAWLDCWALSRGVQVPALALAWLNYMLEPGPAEVLVNRHGLANTLAASPYNQPQDQLLWLEPVEDAEKRSRLWARIMAGHRATKVLQP